MTAALQSVVVLSSINCQQLPSPGLLVFTASQGSTGDLILCETLGLLKIHLGCSE